jgi:hypothetical protein
MTTPTKDATASAETDTPIDAFGLSLEAVATQRAALDPTTFPVHLPEIRFRYPAELDAFVVGEEQQIHPEATTVTRLRADVQHQDHIVARRTAELNGNIRENPLTRAEARAKDAPPILAKLRGVQEEADQGLARLATEAKKVMGPAADPDLPPTEAQMAKYGRMAAGYARLSPDARRPDSATATDPEVIQMKLHTHFLEWNGTKAEQEAVRLGQVKPIIYTAKQHSAMRGIRQAWTGLAAVKRVAADAERAMVKGVDQRLALAAGLIPTPIASLTGKERAALITEIGLEAYERRLHGLE